MSPAELAVHDAADRVRVTEAAIAASHRAIALKRERGAHSVEPQLANLARLELQLVERRARLAEVTA